MQYFVTVVLRLNREYCYKTGNDSVSHHRIIETLWMSTLSLYCYNCYLMHINNIFCALFNVDVNLPKHYNRNNFTIDIRNTKRFLYNNQYTPVILPSPDSEKNDTSKFPTLGTKKCFVISVRGNYSWITSHVIDTRLEVVSRLSLDQYFFECTDFTKSSRNCQNVMCMIRNDYEKPYKLACILHLPPCASHIYYLEWKGKSICGVPDFVFFTEDTDSKTIMNSFLFKKLQLTKNTDITFVQQVLGPSTKMMYLCFYNHFDNCLELLPDGPSALLPHNVWKGITMSRLICISRKHNKCISSLSRTGEHTMRSILYHDLPRTEEIFETIKKKPNNNVHYRFLNGKRVRDNLRLLHVSVMANPESRIVPRYRSFFAIPLLGSKLGCFANVNYTHITNIHKILHNGISVDDHNSKLEQLASSIVRYQICDNEISPIIVTINCDQVQEYKCIQCKETYGDVLSKCFAQSLAIVCFVCYTQYCNPIILTAQHKKFLQCAVGNGSGSRHCCTIPPSVTNLYFGSRRFPTLAQPSPVVGPKMTSHHDNYRKHWNAPMLASFVQISNRLTSAIHHISRWVNPLLEHACCNGSSSIGKSYDNWQLCRTTIITFASNDKYLGFLNTSHIDKNDLYKTSIQKDLLEYSNNVKHKEVRHYLTSNLKIGIGKPTTCTYQFINYKEDFPNCVLYQFFLYDGLQIAMRIHDFACKTFYGHMATHRTAMPVIVRNNKVFYTDENIGVFAWGKS